MYSLLSQLWSRGSAWSNLRWENRNCAFWHTPTALATKGFIPCDKITVGNVILRVKISVYGLILPLLWPFMSTRPPVCFLYLYNIRHIRKFLSRRHTETLIHAFSTSRLDCCNSLLYGQPGKTICKLQRIQNACAGLIYCSPKFATLPLFSLNYIGYLSDKELPLSCYW